MATELVRTTILRMRKLSQQQQQRHGNSKPPPKARSSQRHRLIEQYVALQQYTSGGKGERSSHSQLFNLVCKFPPTSLLLLLLQSELLFAWLASYNLELQYYKGIFSPAPPTRIVFLLLSLPFKKVRVTSSLSLFLFSSPNYQFLSLLSLLVL